MDRKSYETLLNAVEAAAVAEQGYLAGIVDRHEYRRAMDHVAVCRDAAKVSFFRLVRLPERAALSEVA